MDKKKKEEKIRFSLGDPKGREMFESKLSQNIKNKSFGSLSMSRVPIDIRNDFVEMAKENFADDYGACLTHVFTQCAEYYSMKGQLIDLGSLVEKINQLEFRLKEHIDNGEEIKVKRALDGSPIKKGK